MNTTQTHQGNICEGKRKHSEMMDTCSINNHEEEEDSFVRIVPHHTEMMTACSSGNHALILSLLNDATSKDSSGITRRLLASQQDPTTGKSPLMLAAAIGHLHICQTLLEEGAPWNALDRFGKCAGSYATENEHWEVVNLLVEYGTRAELILGASIRLERQLNSFGSAALSGVMEGKKDDKSTGVDSTNVCHQPCTKPDYLIQTKVRYDAANTLLLDDDNDAVMMEWERPLMEAHASFLAGNAHSGTDTTPSIRKRVLNIGFGLGIIDTAIQSYNPSLHVIVEAHPTVYNKMLRDGWDQKENVRICFGRWQDELPKLIAEGIVFDGIFYDTYGEHFTDLEDFHALMVHCLARPNGFYSFFNGLAPDNLFFHGVACNCIKMQLSHLGLDTEFLPCDIQVDEKVWDGVRRKYWHGRDTYYLPLITWKK
ncbi:hypothetical protein ACHAWX_000452 [Stephanocyclus meneghinianus]